MKPIDLGLIQARRKKIHGELAAENLRHAQEVELIQRKHQHVLDVLQKEFDELGIAERVFSRLSQDANLDAELPLNGDAETKETVSTGKPEGLPPVSDMIREALAHAVTLGFRGMKPSAILSYIHGRYWAGATSRDVGPIAWRMWQNDQLEKYQTGEYALLDAEVEKIQDEINRAAASMPPPSPELPPVSG
jgi:hypothetical protein